MPQVPTSSCGGREPRPSRRTGHENAATTSSLSRDEFRPSFASFIPSENRGCREGRVAAAPGAPAQKKLARARKPQVQADTLRPSPRSGLRLIRALPGEPAFATVVGAMRKHRRQLSACIGAPGPHDFAVRVDAARPQHLRVHRMPASRVVTFAIRPLAEAGCQAILLLFRKLQAEYFLTTSLTSPGSLIPLGKFRFWRTRFHVPEVIHRRPS